MNENYGKAIEVADKAHRGQKDLSGEPYFNHVERVIGGAIKLNLESGGAVNADKLVCVAALHDVVEDTDMTLEDLLEIGFSKEVVEAVDAITKRAFTKESYEEYLDRVSKNKIATIVKIADLKDNMDVTRFKRPLKSKDLYRVQKYHEAYLLLSEVLKG